jgi:hypothetical protein
VTPIILPIIGSVDPRLLAGLESLRGGLTSASNSYNEISAAVTDVMARMGALADEVTSLATEQDQLDRTSRRLGLNFDDMATAAGRFTDETQAMGLATTLAAQGLHLTQQQGEGLMTAIGAASVRQNITMQEAIDRTTAAIVRGRATGLQPYGEEVARLSGSAHTANERMVAIAATAEHVSRATDTAADQVARLRDGFDDSKRTVAASFVRELAALQSVTTNATTTEGAVEDLSETFTTVGETIATAMARAVVGVQMLGAAANIVIGGITGPIAALSRAASIEGVGIDAARARLAALRDGINEESRNGRSQTASREMERLIAQAEAITERAEGAGARRAFARTPEGRRAAAAEAARERADNPDAPPPRPDRGGAGTRRDPTADMTFTEAQANADALLEVERVLGIDRAAMAADRARAEVDGLIAVEAARQGAEEMAQSAADKERTRMDEERARLEERAAAHETFTGRLSELYGHQVNAAQMAAEGTQFAFGAIGKSFGEAVNAMVVEGASADSAAQQLLASVLDGISKEALVKGGFYFAQGLGNLAVGNFPGAGQAFAASAGFFTVAGLAGAAGAAVAPAPASAPAAGGGAGNGGAGGSLRDSAGSSGESMAPININYYAPVIGGREATDAELGTRLDRFDNAARQRLRRAA